MSDTWGFETKQIHVGGDPDPTTGALDEFCFVADVTDGSDRVRFSFARANQTEAAEIQFNRQNLATLPFNFGVLATSGVPGTIWVTNAQ